MDRTGFTIAMVVLLSVLAGVAIDAGPRQRVVVLDFVVSDRLAARHPRLGGDVQREIGKRLAKSYDVVDREEWTTALQQLVLSEKDAINSVKGARKLAAGLKADWIVTGRAGLVDDAIAINLKVFGAQRDAFGPWAAVTCDDADAASDMYRPLLEQAGLLPPELEADVSYYEGLDLAERARICRRMAAYAGEDLERVKAAYDWFHARSAKEWADRCLEFVEEHEPDGDWINERRGRRDMREIYRRIPVDPLLDTYPGEALESLRKMKEYAPRWGSEEEYEKARRLIGETEVHLDRLKHDRNYRDTYAIRRWVANHPVLGEYSRVSESRGPWLVFVIHPDTDPAEAAARELLEKSLDRLDKLYDEFHKTIGKKLGLPLLDKMEDPTERVLKVFVFSTRESYDDYHEGSPGAEAPHGVAGYYRPQDQWAIVSAVADAGDGSDAVPPETFENRLLSACATQLFNVYRKIRIEESTGAEVVWGDSRLKSRAYWFEVGFGALLGSSKWPGRGSPKFFEPDVHFLSLLKACREAGKEDWGLEQLLQPEDRFGMLLAAERLSDISDLDRMERLFNAQAWTFCNLLWSFRGKKYRDDFLSYVSEELEGRSGLERFAKSMFGDHDPDWEELGEHLSDHAERLIRKYCRH